MSTTTLLIIIVILLLLGGGGYGYRAGWGGGPVGGIGLIIVVLIPLALTGVRYRPLGAATLLRRFLAVYGLGGIIVPFIGIKLIDLLLVALHVV